MVFITKTLASFCTFAEKNVCKFKIVNLKKKVTKNGKNITLEKVKKACITSEKSNEYSS